MGFSGKEKDAESLVAEALELLQAGRSQAGLSKFEEATRADPTHAQAWYCLGTIHSEAGAAEAAIDCYRQSAQHAPADRVALPLYNMGNVLQSLGRLDEAVRVFTLVTTADPDFSDAWINLGRLLDDSGRHLEAIHCYDKALALVPDEVMALANRGNSLRALNRFDEARDSYKEALAIDPDNPASQVGLGICMGHLGRPDEGLAILDSIRDEAARPLALAERAILLAMLKRDEEALASLDEAIRLGVRNPEIYNNRGEVLARLRRVDESIASFDEALTLDPRYAPALFGKARALCNAKRYGPARETVDLYFKYSDGSDGLEEPARAIVILCQMEEK